MAKRNPQEQFLDKPTRASAIRAKCYDCVGREPGYANLIRNCPQAPDSTSPCALWRFRPYQAR